MQSSRRILSVWLPHLSTDRLKRKWKASGKSDKRLLVVAGKRDNELRLTAVDAQAAQLGLYPGKALADARAMVPNISVVRTNEAADLRLLKALADWCERYTPLVALDFPQGLLLDITGVSHLFGGEASMLGEIRQAVVALGFTIRLALAGTAETARALAHYATDMVVQPTGEAEAVALLPAEALQADAAVIHALNRAGLKTVGQVAGRSRHELAARFGGPFVSLLERTLGREGGPITPRLPIPDLITEQRFVEPIVAQAMIEETLLALAGSLASVLEGRGQGARILEAGFFRADGQVRRIKIVTGEATRDPKRIGRLFRERLEQLDRSAQSGLRLRSHPAFGNLHSRPASEDRKLGCQGHRHRCKTPDRHTDRALRRPACDAVHSTGYSYPRGRFCGCSGTILRSIKAALARGT